MFAKLSVCFIFLIFHQIYWSVLGHRALVPSTVLRNQAVIAVYVTKQGTSWMWTRKLVLVNKVSLMRSLSHFGGEGLKCILLVPNLRPRFCCC